MQKDFTQLRWHSRSLKVMVLVLFYRPLMISCRSSIVTMVLSCTVSETA